MDKYHPPKQSKPEKPELTLEGRLDQALKEGKEHYDQYLRARADLDNYKKQSLKDREEFLRFRFESLFNELLSVMDHLKLAIEHATGEAAEPNPIVAGVELVLKQLQGILERQGLKPIEALGKPFDPRFHEAVAQLSSPDHPANTVVAEHQTGYLMGHQVLRPSRVTVSKSQ